MWIQMVTTKNLEIGGKVRAYHRGDWVEVGKHDAMLMIGRGEAILPKGENLSAKAISSGSGVAVLDNEERAKKALATYSGLQISKVDGPALLYERTMIWETSAEIPPALVSIGFHLLNKWEIAVPLYDYRILACNNTVGTDAERRAAKDVIRDLRVPMYDTRVMFVKIAPDTQRLFKIWIETEGDRRLSFLIALYKTKPLVLALPASWAGVNVPI